MAVKVMALSGITDLDVAEESEMTVFSCQMDRVGCSGPVGIVTTNYGLKGSHA